MKSSRIIVSVALFVLCVLLTCESRARACQCIGALPPIQEMAEAKAVFTGKVVKLTKTGTSKEQPWFFDGYDVTIEVATVIKGTALKDKAAKILTVHTGTGEGDCGYYFVKGERYLIYASGTEGKLETDICTRTQPLKGAEDEVLELQQRLPKIAAAPHPPEIVLKGTLDDAGYQGYVFELRNYLHERIFYSQLLTQVFRDGKWSDYPFHFDFSGARKTEPPEDEVAKMLSNERTEATQADEERGLRGHFLSRMSGNRHFAALQSQSLPWRIGVGYATEQEMIGKDLSRTRHFVWGPRIEALTTAPKLTFREAFAGTAMIPYPLGTKSTSSSTDQK